MKNILKSYLILLVTLTQGCISSHPSESAKVENARQVIVYSQAERFAGWPANCGAWGFDNYEILVGFIEAPYQLTEGHNISEPYDNWLARSTDGGESWTPYNPENYVGDFGDQPELKVLDEPIDFESPGFVMRMVGTGYHGAQDPRGHFFYSMDAGRTWDGPYGFGEILSEELIDKSGLDELTPRTDYLVIGKHECILFISAREEGVFGSDRLFCVKTVDGGQTFEFLGWVVESYNEQDTANYVRVQLYEDQDKNPFETECRAVMPSSVMMRDGSIVSTIRRKYIVKGGADKNWVDAYISTDKGLSWNFLAKAGDTGRGNGNPPALQETEDGRLCLAYGNRLHGTVEICYSSDKGKSWSEPQVLMDGFWSEDMEFNDLGYPRLILRPDGKMVALFYYSTKEYPHHLHATIWQP